MKYRAVANGNIVDDVPESLVAVGLYVPIEDDGTKPEAPTRAPQSEPEPVKQADTSVSAMTTADAPQQKRMRKR